MPYSISSSNRSRLCRSAVRALLSSMLFFPLLLSSVYAAETAIKPDIRLVIDVSGSMKKNDPGNLRQPAVDLLVRLLPEGSKAGVWTFGKYVNMLIPHREVDDDWREMAKTKAKEINSVGLFTNIGGALEKAAHDLARPSQSHRTSVILLTDGMVDVSKSPEDNQKEWRRIVDRVLPDIKNADFTIHSVALSENADENLLERLAVATDGISAVARDADELMKIFLKAFDVAAPAQQVPLEGNAFAVDSSVEEFTALIFRLDANENTRILSPDETSYDVNSTDPDVNWLRTDRYDLVTVKRPVEGEWVLQAKVDPDSRITVVSDMTLRVKALPNNGFLGLKEILQFTLLEEGKAIKRADFLSLLTNSVSMAYGPENVAIKQAWSHTFDGSDVPQNGIYKVALPEFDQMGVYDIAVEVDGKTFKRRFQHRINIREPFTASIDQSTSESGAEQFVLTVKAHGDGVDYKQTQVAASVTNPKRRKVIKPLGFTDYDHWQTLINPTIAGLYTIEVTINGVDEEGAPFEYVLSPVTFDYQPDMAFEGTEEASPKDTLPEPEITAPEVKPEEPEPPTVEPTQPIDVVEPEVPEPAPSDDSSDEGMPSWLLYAVLGLGNLLILGGGFFLFKKISASGTEDDFDDDDGPEPPLEPLEANALPPEAPEEPAELDAPEIDESDMVMDDGDSDDDELPPMEDLEPDTPNEPPQLDDPIEEDSGDGEDVDNEPPPVVDDVLDEDDLNEEDFGVDDLEGDFEDEPESEVDIEKMEAEMKKEQGLDLSDDDLDGALSDLIDDLGDDNTDDSGIDGEEIDPDDISDIDFDDEDNDK